MKKKLLITLIAIATITLSATSAYAAYKFLPMTKNIYTVQYPDQCEQEWRSGGKTRCQTVSTFDDSGNKCYIVTNKGGDRQAISCVRTR